MGDEAADGPELNRWGLRFTTRATEDAYREWQQADATNVNAGHAASSAITWIGIAIIGCALRPEGFGPWLVGIFGIQLPTVLWALRAVRIPATRRWFPLAIAAGSMNSALLIVGIATIHVERPALSVACFCISSYFTFAIGRIPPTHSAIAVLPGAILQLALLVGMERTGTLEWGDLVMDAYAVVVAYSTGLIANALAEMASRRTYRQERVIEAQRATISQQQDLLKRELSHQVAERSRELGAVLAKSDVTLDVRRLNPGERFAERYKILSTLGAGGMGAVYEVERVTDGEKLALKVVVGEVSGASAARFAREAEIGARVHHPNLVSIVDVGVSSGVPFLAMELVRGGSLEARRSKFGDVAWALPILRQIVEGLAALHDAGVVHRDLKPANVLLAEGGVAKISDFGISRFGALDEGALVDASADTMEASPKPRSSELTGTGVVMGTPLYMAPEGAKSARALDASADVFAFGIIAYEMLTGRAPFSVPAFVLAMADQPVPAPPPIDGPMVSGALGAVVIACLGEDRTKRPRARGLLTVLARPT